MSAKVEKKKDFNKDKPKRENKGENRGDNRRENKEGESEKKFHLTVNCIFISGKGETDFEYKFCKTKSPVMLRYRLESVSWARIIKSIISYASSHLRMKNLKKVTVIKGGKSEKFEGDKLDQEINIGSSPAYDEIKIEMNDFVEK